MLDSLKCFATVKRALSSTSTQILKSVCDQGHFVVGRNEGYRIALFDFKNWLLTRIFLLNYAIKEVDWWP